MLGFHKSGVTFCCFLGAGPTIGIMAISGVYTGFPLLRKLPNFLFFWGSCWGLGEPQTLPLRLQVPRQDTLGFKGYVDAWTLGSARN